MTDLLVRGPARPLAGTVRVPSDKSIGHRALLVAALARGRSRLQDFSFGEDNLSTASALARLGVRITRTFEHDLEVEGVGLFGMASADRALDCGNSGTTMRLLAGLLCAQPFASVLVGDQTLMRRPMMRVAQPLRARGALIDGLSHPSKPGEVLAPLRVGPVADGARLGPLAFESPVSSAQVKSAVLLSGLYADGPTYFREPVLSRDHTERMLRTAGVPLRSSDRGEVELDPRGWDGILRAMDLRIPGDISAAAFLLVAAQIVPGSRITVRAVGVNPTRTGLLDVARAMGGGLAVESAGERAGEPTADLHAWSSDLRPTTIQGPLVPRAIDEIPILCALGARADGETTILDAAELRVKESDRIAAMVSVLRSFGVGCEERPDGLTMAGGCGALFPADVESRGDHRIAMTGCVLGLVAAGVTRVRDVDCIGTSFPRFVETLRELGAEIEVVEDR